MRKIPSVFKRNYDGDRLCCDEVVEGCEWVLAGEGVATRKWDGTCCMVRDGLLLKRYDRKPTKAAYKAHARGDIDVYSAEDFKPAPEGWEAAEDSPDVHTGHWPGWLPVGDGPEDRWHIEAALSGEDFSGYPLGDKTYELCGPKVQNNAEHLERHSLIPHGDRFVLLGARTFKDIKEFLEANEIEGIVFHHWDGRMAKVKRRDFGLPWPVLNA